MLRAEAVERRLRLGDELLGQVLDDQVPVGQRLLEPLQVGRDREAAVADHRLAQVDDEPLFGVDVLHVAAHRDVGERAENAVEQCIRVEQRPQVPDEVDGVEVDADAG